MCFTQNQKITDIVISGIGVCTAIGQGKRQFTESLLNGNTAFKLLERPGRQNGTPFIGAEIPSIANVKTLSSKYIRNTTLTGQVALLTIQEALNDAKLEGEDPARIGLVIGGSNLQQRELVQIYDSYRDRQQYIKPHYGMIFLDSDLCGLCTEYFGINGISLTVGGASASGQLAIIQAMQLIESGLIDTCIALGALMDLSHWELQAFRSLGALGSERYAAEPLKACRPFDRLRDGFIYGESCGAVIIEREKSAIKRHAKPYAIVAGGAVIMDGNRNPNPSYDGEMKAIQAALTNSCLSPNSIDYINPHGTGSIIGDETEVRAIRDSHLCRAYINATKSIIGHGLSAAGTVEIIATLVQMESSRLHPTMNLEDPIDSSLQWVRQDSIVHSVENALTLSMGFGGINTALCLKRY